MKFLGVLRALTALWFCLASASLATAATILLEKQSSSIFWPNGSTSLTIKETTLRPSGLAVNAGGFALKADLDGPLDGNSTKDLFTAWCLDIQTYLGIPSEYVIAAPSFSGDLLSSVQIANIDRLYETGFSSVVLTDPAKSAGFQLALWELIYEDASLFDLSNGSGNFFVSSTSAAAVAAIAFGETLLNGLGGPVTQSYQLIFLESVGHRSQNLVTALPVPIPTALPMLVSGLIALTLLRRRRKRSIAEPRPKV